MTFVSAWKDTDRLYCLADTAVTGSQQGPDDLLVTSFGEVSPWSGNKAVQERLVKIRPIGPKSAIAFSGDVNHSLEYVKELRKRVPPMSLPDAVRQVASQFPVRDEHGFELVLMDFDEEGEPRLSQWDSRNPVSISQVEEHVYIGSIDVSNFSIVSLFENMKSSVGESNIEIDAFHMVVSALQRTTMHYPLMEYGVGGTFFGAFLDRGGFCWQEDMTYIQYVLSDDPPPPKLVKCGEVEDIVYVVGTEQPRLVVMADAESKISSIGDFKEVYSKDINMLNSKYFVWVDLRGNNTTMVRMDTSSLDNPAFKLKRKKTEGTEVRFSLEMRQPLLEVLRRQNPEEGGIWPEFIRLYEGPKR